MTETEPNLNFKLFIATHFSENKWTDYEFQVNLIKKWSGTKFQCILLQFWCLSERTFKTFPSVFPSVKKD